jgi:hypothetical protein
MGSLDSLGSLSSMSPSLPERTPSVKSESHMSQPQLRYVGSIYGFTQAFTAQGEGRLLSQEEIFALVFIPLADSEVSWIQDFPSMKLRILDSRNLDRED